MKISLTKHQTHWLIFIAGLAIFLVGLSPEFIAFQTRFALFAQEMMQHGIRLFPYTYQGPYPDYPVLPTILIYLTSLPFGKVTPFTATLPTAIASALTLLFIYKLGELHSKRWGIYAILFALLTQNFIDASRSISMDQMTSCMTVISFYIIYSSDIYKKNLRLWFLPFCLILGFLLRGPIGFVIPAGVVFSYFLCRHEIKAASIFGIGAVILLAGLMFALIMAAYFEGGRPFVHNVLMMEITGRMGDNATNKHFLYYFIQSITNYAIAYPIALIVILSEIKPILHTLRVKYTSTNMQFLTYLTVWLLVILVGMSIPGAKKIRYILPIVPACALLAAYVFLDPDENTKLTWLRKFVMVICYMLPYLAVALSCAALFVEKHFNLSLSFLPVIALSILLCTAAVWLDFMIKTDSSRKIGIVSLAAIALITINIGILEPVNYALERTQPFIETMQKIEQQQTRPIVFYKIGPDGEDIKFMVNWPKPFNPIFIQDQKILFSYSTKAYFIALKSDFLNLPKSDRINVLARGKLGHRPSIIFEVLTH